jgi:AcrR family transcriptional regulator
MPRRRLSPRQRRAELLDAAHRLFADKPYHQVRLEDVAAVAGSSIALVAFHFTGKRELYVACLRAAVEELLARHAAVPGRPSVERLRASVLVHLAFATEHRAAYLALVRGGHERAFPEVVELLDGVRERLVTRLADAVDRPRTPALELAMRTYLAYVDAATAHWLELPAHARHAIPPETLADLATGAFTGALATL